MGRKIWKERVYLEMVEGGRETSAIVWNGRQGRVKWRRGRCWGRWQGGGGVEERRVRCKVELRRQERRVSDTLRQWWRSGGKGRSARRKKKEGVISILLVVERRQMNVLQASRGAHKGKWDEEGK